MLRERRCACFDPRVFGHLPTCPVRPESLPACAVGCRAWVCSRACPAWQRQRRVFGWHNPAEVPR